jgi:hypothetical protein
MSECKHERINRSLRSTFVDQTVEAVALLSSPYIATRNLIPHW